MGRKASAGRKEIVKWQGEGVSGPRAGDAWRSFFAASSRVDGDCGKKIASVERVDGDWRRKIASIREKTGVAREMNFGGGGDEAVYSEKS